MIHFLFYNLTVIIVFIIEKVYIINKVQPFNLFVICCMNNFFFFPWKFFFCLVLQETLNAKLNKSGIENPWFVFGTSYSGALSAWFRLKFPHLTCGSLSSSGVVLAVYNFTEFDQQVDNHCFFYLVLRHLGVILI